MVSTFCIQFWLVLADGSFEPLDCHVFPHLGGEKPKLPQGKFLILNGQKPDTWGPSSYGHQARSVRLPLLAPLSNGSAVPLCLSFLVSPSLSPYFFFFLSLSLSLSLSLALFLSISLSHSLLFSPSLSLSLSHFWGGSLFFLSLSIYIYIAVVLLSGPSLAFWGVIIWAKFVFFTKTLFVKKHYKFRGFSTFFLKNNCARQFEVLLSGPSWPFLSCSQLGPDNNTYLAQIITPQNAFCFVFFVLKNVLKYLFL